MRWFFSRRDKPAEQAPVSKIISDDEGDEECPKCGTMYKEGNESCIECDFPLDGYCRECKCDLLLTDPNIPDYCPTCGLETNNFVDPRPNAEEKDND